jgi:hypothetical protein
LELSQRKTILEEVVEDEKLYRNSWENLEKYLYKIRLISRSKPK